MYIKQDYLSKEKHMLYLFCNHFKKSESAGGMIVLPSRECLAEVFKDTLAYIAEEQELQNSIIKSIEDTKFYDFSTKIPVDDNHSQEKCVVTVAKNRTFAEVIELREKYRCEKIAVLNFASPTTPGGGVVAGSRAQEESLCRCSTLYPVLETDELWEKYYSYNRSNYSFKATDACIYTPGIKIIKSDVDIPKRLSTDAWVTVDVITCAAPNLGRADYHVSNDELLHLHINRGRRIVEVAIDNDVDVLVLGAFGCGAFKNNPGVVSKAYQLLVEEYKQYFQHISFAVFCSERDKNNYNAFARAFEKSIL